MDGDLPTEDFHLISSCPCWAYTRPLTRGSKLPGPPHAARAPAGYGSVHDVCFVKTALS